MDYTKQLAAETLCYIFHVARSTNPILSAEELEPAHHATFPRYQEHLVDTEQYELYNQVLLAWLPITQVCSRWRVLALGDASLWTNVPYVLGREWMDTFISRSQEMAISLDWSCDEYKTNYRHAWFRHLVENVVPTHRARIQNLVARPVEHSLFSQLCKSWPMLETLELWCIGEIPDFNFLGNHAPRLRHLSLTSTSRCDAFHWMNSSLHHLTILDVEFRWAIEAVSMTRFLDTLTCMPHLRHLHVKDRSSEPAPAHACTACPLKRSVALPLKTFACWAQIPTMLHIMQHIVPPPDARIDLSPRALGNEMRDFLPQICTMLSTWFRTSQSHEFIAVRISHNSTMHAACLNVSRHVNSLTSLMGRPDRWYQGVNGIHPDCSIELDTDMDGTWAIPMMTVLQYIAPNSLRALLIGSDEIHSGRGLRFSDPLFKNIQVLRVLAPGTIALEQQHFRALRVLDIKCYSLSHACSVTPVGSTRLLGILHDRRERTPLRAMYIRIAEEVNAVRTGHFEETSCGGLPEADIRRAIDDLEAAQEVRIVTATEDVDYAAFVS